MGSKNENNVAVFNNAQASSSINVNINNSDIIDVFIEERKEEIQAQWDVLMSQRNELLSKDHVDFDKIGKIALDYYKKDFMFKPHTAEVELCSHNHDDIQPIEFWTNAELGTKKPNMHTRWGSHVSDTVLSIKLRQYYTAKDGNHQSGCKQSYFTTIIPKKLVTLLRKELINLSKTNLNKNSKALKEIDDKLLALNAKYLEFNNSRKIKAMFTKKALSNSADGKGLLDMMKNMNDISLLDSK